MFRSFYGCSWSTCLLQFIFSPLEILIPLQNQRKPVEIIFLICMLLLFPKTAAIKPGPSSVCTTSAQLPRTTIAAAAEIAAHAATAPAHCGPGGHSPVCQIFKDLNCIVHTVTHLKRV